MQKIAAVVAFTTLLLAGCSSSPTKPAAGAVVFAKPPAVVQKAAVEALVVNGFEVEKSEPLYIEGARPRRIGLLVGSGGEGAAVWLEPIENSKTRVYVDTKRTAMGIAGQRVWTTDILQAME